MFIGGNYLPYYLTSQFLETKKSLRSLRILYADSKSNIGVQQCLEQWFWNLSGHQNHLEVLLKHRLLGPPPRVSDSVSLGWGLICIFNGFPGNAYAAGLGNHILRLM